MLFNIMRRIPLFILISETLIVIQLNSATEYCKINKNHTMCIYHSIGPACGALVVDNGLNELEKRIILEEHNLLRQRVATGQEKNGAPGPQPQAANMIELTWNEEIADFAQMWSQQCRPGHDCTVCSDLEKYHVGQSEAWFTNYPGPPTSTFVRETIDRWYSEVSNFSNTLVNKYMPDLSHGQYAQLVWANVHQVGCGYIHFFAGYAYIQKYVCNYLPTGVIESEKVYKVGPPCSACPEGSKCSTIWPGLCALTGVAYGIRETKGLGVSAYEPSPSHFCQLVIEGDLLAESDNSTRQCQSLCCAFLIVVLCWLQRWHY